MSSNPQADDDGPERKKTDKGRTKKTASDTLEEEKGGN